MIGQDLKVNIVLYFYKLWTAKLLLTDSKCVSEIIRSKATVSVRPGVQLSSVSESRSQD